VSDGPLAATGLPRVGRFQTLGELGVGAMGRVYRAHDDVLGRAVAIKLVHGPHGAPVRERFLREARAIARVMHANILAVHDAGMEGDTPYIVMELAESSLRDRLASGPLAASSVRQLGIQIAQALAAAHAAKILHRDVKPANILCASSGAWKLADFGIAHVPDSTLTASGQFVGSPAYAAPESLRAGAFSPASDVYGLAATLYEALTGAPPHGTNHASVMRKLDVDAPALAADDVLARAIMAGLARDPARRPTATELAQLLAAEAPATAAPARRTLAIAAIAVAGVAAILLWIALGKRSAPAPATSPVTTPVTIPEAPRPTPEPPRPTTPEPPRPTTPEPPSGAALDCATFRSDARSATWSGCSDRIVRSVACDKFIDDYKCDCIEDGSSRWFFHVRTLPDFTNAAALGKLATASCEMSFGK